MNLIKFTIFLVSLVSFSAVAQLTEEEVFIIGAVDDPAADKGETVNNDLPELPVIVEVVQTKE